MKKPILLIAFSLISIFVFGQDIIVMRNGDIIQSKVNEISSTEIKYKKFSNLNGPTYTVEKAKVLSITYENGDKEMITTEEVSLASGVQPKSATPQLVQKEPAANNVELIKRYHSDIVVNTKQSASDAKYCFPIVAVTKNSVLSNEDVEITIEPKVIESRLSELYLVPVGIIRCYVAIKNKSNNMIYIDKGKSFKINSENISEPYYDAKQVTVTQGSSDRVSGVLFGGLLGGDTRHGAVSENHTEQRFLAIPPHTSVYLSEYKEVQVTGKKFSKVSDAERWELKGNAIKRGIVQEGECKLFTEEESPFRCQYRISYSQFQDFSAYSTVSFGVYAKYIVGEMSYSGDCANLKILKKVRKIIPDFMNNPGILLGETVPLNK